MFFAIVMHHYIDIRVVALAAPIPPEWWKLLVIQMHNSRKQRDGGGGGGELHCVLMWDQW